MARTTYSAVLEILPENTGMIEATITPFITVASLVVDDLDSGTTLSDAVLTEIERWLAAHLISITRERQAKIEKLGEAEISYAGQFGMDLKSTTYGQMASMLDTSGMLARLGKKALVIKAITSFDS